MRIRPVLLAGVAATALILSSTRSDAQIPVIDASNLAQNIMTAARELQQINNQITQIEQGIQMLENQARNLTSLPTSILSTLTSDINQLTQLMNRAQGIVFNVAQAQQQFQQLYPQSYSGTMTGTQYYQNAQSRWLTSLQALSQSVAAESRIVTDITSDRTSLNQAVTASQSAVGGLQATQAANQLIALQAKQISELQAMLAAHERAEDLELSRKAEDEAAAQAQWQQFIGTGVQYTPQPVQIFNGQ